MATAATHRPTTRRPWSNISQIVGWVVLLFSVTVIGALPMLLQGVNLTKISQSTPYLPLILVGMLVTSCSPTLAALLVAGLCPGAGGLRSVFRGVREWRVGLIWYAIALVGPARAINAVRLGVLPTHLPSFSAPEAADALWGSCGWC